MKTAFVRRFLVTLALISLLGGAALAQVEPLDPPERVSVAYVPIMKFAPLYVAAERGRREDEVVLAEHVELFERLTNDHARGGASEVVVVFAIVDREGASARRDPNASDCRFTATSGVGSLSRHGANT